MPLSRDQLLSALEVRYDYHSARAMLGDTLAEAGVEADDQFSDDEVEAICRVLGYDARSDALIARVRRWAGLGPAPEALGPNVPDTLARAADPTAPDATEAAEVLERLEPSAAPDDTSTPAQDDSTEAADEPAEPVAVDAPDVAAQDPEAQEEVRERLAREELEGTAPSPVDDDEPPATTDRDAAAENDQTTEATPSGTIEITVALGDVPAGTARVAMVGNLPALGDWTPTDGLELKESDGGWSATLRTSLGADLEYKFVRFEGDEPVWEGGENRSLHVAPDTSTIATGWQS